MKTIFLLDDKLFLWTLILVSLLIAVLFAIWVKIVIISPLKDEIAYKYWPAFRKIVFHIIPGMLLLAIIIHLTIMDINAIVCKYQWDHGEYQIAEGELSQLSIHEFWINGEQEPSYECSFWLEGVYFPPKNRYTKQQIEMLSSASYVKVYYLYNNEMPWLWKIDIGTEDYTDIGASEAE